MKKVFILFFVFAVTFTVVSVVKAQGDSPAATADTVLSSSSGDVSISATASEVSRLQREMEAKIKAIRAEYQPKIEAAKKAVEQIKTAAKQKKVQTLQEAKQRKTAVQDEIKKLREQEKKLQNMKKKSGSSADSGTAPASPAPVSTP